MAECEGSKTIVGYSTSHDAGISIVDENGVPSFAASLERISRIKNNIGSPLPLYDWLSRIFPKHFQEWRVMPIFRDDLFPEVNGFHRLEFNEDIDHLSYRWTASQAVIHLRENSPIDRVCIELVEEKTSRQFLEADVLFDGCKMARINNRQRFWVIGNASGKRLEGIQISPVRVLRYPPDPRELGIMIRSVAVHLPDKQEECNHLNVLADEDSLAELWRLLKKEFIGLPVRGIRGYKRWMTRDSIVRYLSALLSGHRALAETLFADPVVRFSSCYDHHLCHGASAYYPSGFASALVVTLDRMGNLFSCRVLRGQEGRLKHLHSYPMEEVPTGCNYEIVTMMLGFNALRHAGKITGLAAYGKENPTCIMALNEFLNAVWRRRNRYAFDYHDFGNGEAGRALLCKIREEEFGQFSREDLAYAIQKRTEEEICGLIANWRAKTPDLDSIVLAGGVFANVKLNKKIKEMGFRNIFVQPAMSDAGLCLGAALLEAAKQNGGRLKPFRLKDVFLGVGYSNEEIRAEIDKHGLKAKYFEEDQIASVIARHIADRKVLAHFYGRMEFGPRALGNRSILYSASDPDVNTWLNDQLNRTEFMPFAPAVMAEHAAEYFLNIEGAEYAAEFMTITFDCTEKAGREIPAAIHVDNTARPQFVVREHNPRFHAILSAYRELTGVPVVINTSFNMHEEPIVASPYDAIRCYQLGHLDVLVMGNYIIENAER